MSNLSEDFEFSARDQIFVAGAAIVRPSLGELEVLSARRHRPQELAGLWEFPGGKLEKGESFEQALHRELREELSAEVAILDELPGDQQDGSYDLGNGFAMKLFVCAAISEITLVRNDTHDEFCWLNESQLHNVEWLPGDKAAVEHLRSWMQTSKSWFNRG